MHHFHHSITPPAHRAFPRLHCMFFFACFVSLFFTNITPAQVDLAGNDILIALPKSIAVTDQIPILLRGKRYDDALARLTPMLETTTANDLFICLYERGLAQLFLGIKTNNENMIKDAGISFMSVVIYNPRSNLVGACLMETALVHQRIGRDDLATSLYEKAALIIDPQQEPDLTRRLGQLYGSFKREHATLP